MSLSLGTGNNLPHYCMLVVGPAFYLSYCDLPREPKGRFQSNKLVKSEPIGNLISTNPRMSGYPEESHRMVG